MDNLIDDVFPEEIAKDTIFIFMTQALMGFSLFIIAVIIGQRLGSEGLGVYSVIAALYAIFQLTTFLGLDNLIVRELAKHRYKVKKYVGNLVIFGVISSMIGFAIMTMVVRLINYPLQIRVAAYIMGLGLLPNFYMLLNRSVFIAFKKTKYVFYVNIITYISWIILTFIFLSLNQGIYMVMWSFLAAFILGSTLSFYYLNKYITPFYFELDFSFFKNIGKTLFIFALIAIVDQILIRSDVIILSKIRNTNEVGWYSAAYKFLRLGFLFTFSFVTVMFPVLSKLSYVSKNLFEDICNKSVKYLFFFIFPLAVVMMFFSDNLILFFFREKFVNSIIALQILIWALIPFSVSFLLSKILIAKNKQNKVLLSLFLGLIVMFISTIIMTYQAGYVGTALAVVFTISVTAICQYLFVRRHVFKMDILSPFLKVGLSAFCMLACVLFLNSSGTNKYLSGLYSLAVYLFFIYILRIFTRGELQVVRSVYHKFIQRIFS